MIDTLAPEIAASHWFNIDKPLKLSDLRGKVVVIEAFQMLCPGCVAHGLPQASLIAQTFAPDQVQVIGLHTVFEHHEVQGTNAALAAFIHEYRLAFPIAIDTPQQGTPVPQTMAALNLRGTPSLIIIDQEGIIRHNHFGRPDDMAVGAQIMVLIMASQKSVIPGAANVQDSDTCRIDGDCG